MAKIHLVRHGRTVLNEQRRTQGACDSPLTPQGRQGAEACRDYLAGTRLASAYTSPQGRAVETAGILLQAHPGLAATPLSGLREYDYGVYDGGPDAQMHAALPVHSHLPAVLAGTHPGAPDGIHARDYLAHVDAALARILLDLRAAGQDSQGSPEPQDGSLAGLSPGAGGGREASGAARPSEEAAGEGAEPEVLVVSHGMTLMTLALRWLGPEVLGMGPLANCSVTTVRVDPGAPDGEPELVAWGYDPGDQGVTFPVGDMTGLLDTVVLAPLDLSRPEGL